jgi:hypothetical protein
MKKTLAGFVLATLFSVQSLAQTSKQHISEPNQRLHQIQEIALATPGIEQVTLCETPGAKYGLVHIRQAHFVSPSPFIFINTHGTQEEKNAAYGTMRRLYTTMNEVQRHAYTLLVRLSDNGYRTLYAEGLLPEQQEFLTAQNAEGVYLQNLAYLRKAGFFRDDPAGKAYVEYRAMDHNLNNYQAPNGDRWEWITPEDNRHPASLESFRYIAGLELLLATEGRVQLQPFEDKTVYEMTEETDNNEIRMDGRENMFLEQLATVPGNVAITILGAVHAFGGNESCGAGVSFADRESTSDNVALWNRHHPDKISLLEISPAGIDAVYRLTQGEIAHQTTPMLKRIVQRVQAGPR